MRRRIIVRGLAAIGAAALLLTGCNGTGVANNGTDAAKEETTVTGTSEVQEETVDPDAPKPDDRTTEAKGEAVPEIGETTDDGYTLVWQDNFDEESLDLTNWNYEYHDPGWVNNELQSYVDSSENVYLKDGALTIQAIKTENADGTVSYTSGRVNTQNKQDYTYGRFEIRAKAPSGKGFLPAIWMMPTDENLYGQWPKCGEIDIMEVLGDDTDTTYSTVHYGEPHTQNQAAVTADGFDYSEEYHTYALEWEPGEMRFYVDGVLSHTENDWFTKKDGFEEITYPAPFDQPFYLILNLAVGGDWPGNPDDSTAFDENAQLLVDYVRIYQKDSYDDNVTRPEEEIVLRDPDETGNYIEDGDFSIVEDTEDGEYWKFLTAGSGKATCEIADGAIHIETENPGDLDYSVQLVSADVPMEQGATYHLTYDAYADEDRTAIVAITAPNVGWIRYLTDTVFDLTTEKQSYSYDIVMTEDTDATARLEFNLGNQPSTAAVHISNIRLEKVSEGAVTEDTGCLPDGNYVRNGGFECGNDRMSHWSVVTDNTDVSTVVTNENCVREFTATIPESVTELSQVILQQENLNLGADTDYVLKFTAKGDAGQTIGVSLAGNHYDAELAAEENTYSFSFTSGSEAVATNLQFEIGAAGTITIDNVSLTEDALLLNGSFNSSMTGFEVYAYTASDVSYVVDTLNEDSAFCIDISNTGDLDWKIQLKQCGILLEKGATYRLSFDAKSNLDRTIMYALQRDGSSDDDWTPYSGSQYAELTGDFQTFTTEFTMESPTDAATILSISMGAVGGTQITEKHTVTIDNIVLEKVQ